MTMAMTKARFLKAMRSEHERWEALLSKIDAGEMEHPGVAGNWSARDIIVHMTAYERGLVEWLEAARQGAAKTFTDLDHPDVDYGEKPESVQPLRGWQLLAVEMNGKAGDLGAAGPCVSYAYA